MTEALLSDDALARLKLAAEEMAFLGGRGYPQAEVRALVASRRALTAGELALLDRAVCSEPQYKSRAMKEMLPEDIARRPLLIDGHDVLDAVTTALAGLPLLEGLDQTVQPLAPPPEGAPSARVDDALAKIGPILREMRPSKTKWLLASSRADAPALKEKLTAAAKKWKVPVECELVEDPKRALKGLANVVSSDPFVIDASKSWCNLAGPVVATVEGARRIKIQ